MMALARDGGALVHVGVNGHAVVVCGFSAETTIVFEVVGC